MTTYVLDGWSSWLDLLEHHARQQHIEWTGWADIIDAIDELRYASLTEQEEVETWARETLIDIVERYA